MTWRAGEVAAEGGLDGGGEAVAVGVEALPAAFAPAEGVDGADGTSRGIDLGDAVERDDFVGNGEVDAAEFLRVQKVERLREIVGMDLETEVLPIGEAGVGAGEFGQRGVVHRRADRVFDRVTEDGERGAGARPRGEVGQGEHGGDFRFSISDSRLKQRPGERAKWKIEIQEIENHSEWRSWVASNSCTKLAKRFTCSASPAAV
jgi:hypothetical protein